MMIRLRKRLAAKLVQSGWRDDMQGVATDVVRDRGGVTQITLDELSAELVSQGRDSVPQNIKDEIMTELRDLMRQNANSGYGVN